MSETPYSAEQLIEQAHLAILRQAMERARHLLKQALALDPQHPEALRMLQSLPSPHNSQPRWDGETEHDFAARIAFQAGMDERARLEGNPWIPAQNRSPVLWLSSSRLGRSIQLAAAPLFILFGILTMIYLPAAKHSPVSIGDSLHFNRLEDILAGAILGLFFHFWVLVTPSSRRRLRGWR